MRATFAEIPFRLTFLMVVLAALAATSCAKDDSPTCAAGTVLEDGACVARPECGAGTRLDGDQCVPIEDDAVSGDTSEPDASEPDTSEADASEPDASEPDSGECTPDCAGKACGVDGCGGICGDCEADQLCTALGQCASLACVPDCSGKSCGGDGCGGECGSCTNPAAPFCVDGACVAECVPSCLDHDCGGDGCGGSCGVCTAGSSCSLNGHCVPDGWTCPDGAYDAGDHCDCECGVADPDCDLGGIAVLGCDLYEACQGGSCVALVPAGWTCSPEHHDDGVYCDCTCGVPDPDCLSPVGPTLGCGNGEACGADGACQPCVPSCDGKVCGTDGCGGSCGGCTTDPSTGESLACVAGACVPGCGEAPIACEGRECGDDGCGGVCGTCVDGTTCYEGQCLVKPGLSCAGLCGIQAPGGCYCDTQCVDNFDCCPDYVAQCTCSGDCTGRTCGDDGCGGSCGVCTDGELPYCSPDGACVASCIPSCDGKACGDDGCGGSCGACPGGECNDVNLCVPASWTCASHYYGDGALCDCSCGAPDPDCATIGQTIGCPDGALCDAATGLCDVAFCLADAACPEPKQCVGQLPTGVGSLGGVCDAPNAAAAPPGSTCVTGAGCSTGVCAAGRCRHHCQKDADCAGGETCIGVPVAHPLSGIPLGILSVCDLASEIGGACGSQAACAGDTHCLALLDPVTWKPALRCALAVGGGGPGAQCDAVFPCAPGLVCADATCLLPCPGGQADCGAGETCSPRPFFVAPAGVVVPSIPVCVP